MKIIHYCAILLSIAASSAVLALTIPSDGSDGVFSPTSDVVIDLALATDGAWDADNTANAGNGIYDADEWAVVFKYASVNIPSDVTVTFVNHPTTAPVVWLVDGDVMIEGTVNLSGENGTSDSIGSLIPTVPGPGGFRGGAFGPEGNGHGYGPGGGSTGGSGLYANTYGNPQIIPLVGGSGGGTNTSGTNVSGGAGGGAILIATPGSMTVNGAIEANGGASFSNQDPDGSGGAIRLIADSVAGAGSLSAVAPQRSNAIGRIRIEANSLATTVQLAPDTVAVTPLEIPIIWPADDAPSVRVVSVNGVDAPLDPEAPLQAQADIGIENNGPVQVVLETTNFPISGVVELRTVQKYGSAAWVEAAYESGDFASAQWVVNVTFTGGFTTLQSRATVP